MDVFHLNYITVMEHVGINKTKFSGMAAAVPASVSERPLQLSLVRPPKHFRHCRRQQQQLCRRRKDRRNR
jgi:hypothetical protein